MSSPSKTKWSSPKTSFQKNGVLNTGCLLVLVIYCTIGFYGYLCFGNNVKDTITLSLPNETFYQLIRILLVCCILVSYPLQFFVPMERVEKWVSRKIVPEKQIVVIYFMRYTLVALTCIFAELIPHLALFISLIGAFAGASLALVFPPIIELLCKYAEQRLSKRIWIKNIFLMLFGFIGFTTGTYTSLLQIIAAFGEQRKI